MLTRDQQLRAVAAITSALATFTSGAVAEERARNLVTALTFDPDDHVREIVAGTLLVRRHDIRQFWDAVDHVLVAYACARESNNLDRFAMLTRSGMSESGSAEYLRANWPAVESVEVAHA
jgi:hypothetical protein